MEYTGFRPQAQDEQEPTLDLNSLIIRNKAIVFFAQMTGNAMSKAGIRHGDLLVIEPAETYSHGHIVLVFHDYRAIVRRLERARNGFELHTSHPEQKPLILGEDAAIRGRVVASITLHRSPRVKLPVAQ